MISQDGAILEFHGQVTLYMFGVVYIFFKGPGMDVLPSTPVLKS